MKTHWFIFNSRHELLLEKVKGQYRIPCKVKAPANSLDAEIDLPSIDDLPAKAFAADAALTAEYEYVGLRQSYSLLPFEQYYAAGKAAELVYFHTNTKYCSKCGSLMTRSTDISRKCTDCGREIWAPVQPAIIVLIHKGNDEILLVRNKSFRGTFHGLVAGFVETGETLEECVAREVMEETSLHIKNIRYYKSQPWPYPSNMMMGFFAEYESGDICLKDGELESAQWYKIDQLPEIPPKLSMARMLIDEWIRQTKG